MMRLRLFHISLAVVWVILPATASLVSALPADDPSVIGAVVIHIEPVFHDERALKEIAARLIRLTPGVLFSPADLQAGIDALVQSNRFESIHADILETGNQGPVTVEFRLTPRRLMKNISIRGGFPMFEREILNAMTLRVGGAFQKKEMAAQPEKLEALFREDGYISPRVTVTAREDPLDGSFEILVKIDKGPVLKAKAFSFSGNHAVKSATLKWMMETWRSGFFPGANRLSENKLKKDIQTLTAYYRKKGFADVEIDYLLTQPLRPDEAMVEIRVSEGRRYQIHFSGNTRITEKQLEKDLPLLRESNTDDRAVYKSLGHIRNQYRDKGYVDASVRFEAAETGQGRSIRFLIAEGSLYVIETVAVETQTGEPVDTKAIREQILSRPPGLMHDGVLRETVLENDVSAVNAYYRRKGYTQAHTEKKITTRPDGKRLDQQLAHIHIAIDTGTQTIVSAVDFSETDVISRKTAMDRVQMKPGDPFRSYMLDSDANAVSEAISETGHPHVVVAHRHRLSLDLKQAFITYDINPGPFVRMGNYYFSGNFKTRPSALMQAATLKSGEPFSLMKLVETQNNLLGMPMAASVGFRVVGLKEKAETVDLFVEIEEKKPYYLESAGGVASEQGLYFNAKIGDRNAFGLGIGAGLSGDISRIGHYLDFNLTHPNLFGTQTAGAATVFTEKKEPFNQNFGYSINGVSLSVSRKWRDHWSTGYHVGFENRKQHIVDDPISVDMADIGENALDSRSIVSSTLSLGYDSRDSVTRPESGWLMNAYVTLSDGLGGDMDDFLKYGIHLRRFYSPHPRLILAASARFRQVDSLSGQTEIPRKIPMDQLFFLGGGAAVRGFDENMLAFDAKQHPMGGTRAINTSLEARVDMGYGFELLVFEDSGTVSGFSKGAMTTGFRHAAGVGIGYRTPLGPVGITYGWKLNPQAGESAGRLHFSIGYSF